jgi:hypothetical protein
VLVATHLMPLASVAMVPGGGGGDSTSSIFILLQGSVGGGACRVGTQCTCECKLHHAPCHCPASPFCP